MRAAHFLTTVARFSIMSTGGTTPSAKEVNDVVKLK